MTPARDDGHLRYLLTAYLFGNLSDDGRAEVEAHLSACAACRAELAELRETRALVEEALAVPGAGGGEGAASEDAPAAPYSFEAHRLERVLAAGKRGALFGSRIGWYSAAAMFIFAFLGWLILPNLVTARRKGASLPPSEVARIRELQQAGREDSFALDEERGATAGRPNGSEIASGGSGGGAGAPGYRGDFAPPPASTPAPASPNPGSAQPDGDDNGRAVLVASVQRARIEGFGSIQEFAQEPQPVAIEHMGLAAGSGDGSDAPETTTFSGGVTEDERAAEQNVALGEVRKSPGAGGKLDSESARHGRDRAAAAADPAQKPAAPAEEVSKNKELEKSVRAGEKRDDRSDIAMKQFEDVTRDQIEVDGSLPPTDADRQRSKERAGESSDAKESKDIDSFEVLDLAGQSKNEELSDETGRLAARSAGLGRRALEPAAIAPPGAPPVGGAAPSSRESATRMLEGERGVVLQEFEGERRNEPRYGQSAQGLDNGTVLANPPIGSLGELREADKKSAEIYAYDAVEPVAESGGLTPVDQERRGGRQGHETGQFAGYDLLSSDDPSPNTDQRRFAGGGSAPPEDLVELGFIEVEESLPGLQEPVPTQIPALNLMRVLQEQTGLIVNYPSSGAEPAFDNPATIDILGDNIALDPPMVAAILETNGFEIRRERLQDGSDVLNVSPSADPALAGAEDPTLALQANFAVQDALLSAAREQAPQLGLRFAPTPLDLKSQMAGLVLRAPRTTLEQVPRAVEFAESGAVSQDPTALAGWFSGVLAGTISPLPGSDLAQRAESRADEERTLRAFDHYKQNDPTLDHRTFAARRLPVPAPVIGDEGLGQEGFRARYGVNPFVEAERDRYSTFAMDVDTASYTRARTIIAEGRLPEPKQVRTEEFVNAFPDPRAADPSRAFSVFCEGGPSPFGIAAGRGASASEPLVEQVQITVKARDLAPGERRPAILTFAIDTSGSMELGSRLDLVRSALGVLLDSLAPDDRVAVIAYGSQAYLVLPHTPARERARIAGALDSLASHGATNVEAGLDLAYRLADEVAHPRAASRVILCSDGVATSGERDAQALLRKVRVYADRGIYLSVVGFGQERYDDAFLEEIANKGNGQYGYVSTHDDAVRLFADNLPAALSVLARDAKIQVDFDPAVVRQYRLLGYENRDVKDEDFRNDKIDAGEVGPGSTVTAIYEVVRRPASAGDLGRVHLRYHDTSLGRVEEIDFPIPPGVVATHIEGTSERFRLLASVAEVAELLRESYFARDGAFSAVLGALATLSPATVARPEVQDFIDMSLRARELSLERWAKE